MYPDSLATMRLTLRPVRTDDALPIFDGYAQDNEVTRYLAWRPHTSIEDTERYVRMCLVATSSRTYAVVLTATRQVIGAFDLRSTGSAKFECGYVLARRYWGQGLMAEALIAVVDWALRQPGIWRIGAAADVDNAGSIRVMEKAGLQREGVFRRWIIHPNTGDVPRDCVVYAKVR